MQGVRACVCVQKDLLEGKWILMRLLFFEKDPQRLCSA